MGDMMAEAARRADIDLVSGRNSDQWAQAVEFLKKELTAVAPDIRKAIAASPEWIDPYHFGWGMGVRNLLRQNMFGEKEMHVENLDNIYVELIEEAMQ